MQRHGFRNRHRAGCVGQFGTDFGHWILAVGLASQTPSRESAPSDGIVRRALHSLNIRPWALVLFLFADVIGAIAFVRGGSKPRDGHVLRRPNFRRVCDTTAHVDMGACAPRARIRDRIYSLPARSKRLPNVGSTGSRGSAWTRRQRQQDCGRENGTKISLSFLLSRSSLFLRCTLRLGVRWRHNSLHSRPSTLPSLYIARNGRNRVSQAKALSWSRSINRLARLLERECSRAPGTSYLMALPSKHIRSGVSSRARCRNLGGLFRGRGSFPRHNGLSRWPGWYAEITRNPCGRLHIFCGHRADCGSRPTSRRSSQIVSQNALLDVQWSMNAPGP